MATNTTSLSCLSKTTDKLREKAAQLRAASELSFLLLEEAEGEILQLEYQLAELEGKRATDDPRESFTIVVIGEDEWDVREIGATRSLGVIRTEDGMVSWFPAQHIGMDLGYMRLILALMEEMHSASNFF